MTRGKPALLPQLLSARGIPRCEAGFSFVEILISTLIFAMVSAGSLGLFSITTRQATVSRLLQEEEFAIRLDMANIQNMNDRFTCYSGTCQIDTVGAAPGQAEYFPDNAMALVKFNDLCNNSALLVVPSISYGSGLVTLINATARPTELVSLGITRTVTVDSTSPTANRYSVTWNSSDGSLLRQINLTPTAAAWCP
jgi:type II secretory pathway pseudopilin PulG